MPIGCLGNEEESRRGREFAMPKKMASRAWPKEAAKIPSGSLDIEMRGQASDRKPKL